LLFLILFQTIFIPPTQNKRQIYQLLFFARHIFQKKEKKSLNEKKRELTFDRTLISYGFDIERKNTP